MEAHLAAETENISATGAVFSGNFPLTVGTQLEMLITLPEALVGYPSHVGFVRAASSASVMVNGLEASLV